MLMRFEDFERKLFDEETGGEGEGAPAAGGSLIGGVGETGAEGEGTPGNTAEAGANTAGEGTTEEPTQEAEGEPKGEGEGEGEGEPQGAPENGYEGFEFPEGYEVNQEALDEFAQFAYDRNMSQDQAQEVLDYYTKNVEQLQASQAEAWSKTRNEWVDSAKSDNEYGGQQFQENMKHVATAMKQFGSPELRDLLNDTGMGDNPELIRFFYRVGKLAGEGEFHTGSGGSAGERDPAKTLYPDMN
jgi:hypothetical protein